MFKAAPFTLFKKFTSSIALTFLKPVTLATPSVIEITIPILSNFFKDFFFFLII